MMFVEIVKASLFFLHKREFHQNVLIAPLITPSPALPELIRRNVSLFSQSPENSGNSNAVYL